MGPSKVRQTVGAFGHLWSWEECEDGNVGPLDHRYCSVRTTMSLAPEFEVCRPTRTNAVQRAKRRAWNVSLLSLSESLQGNQISSLCVLAYNLL